MPFEFTPLEIPNVIEIVPRVFRDGRGAFAELFKAAPFREQGITEPFVQVNYSRSERDVLRGMHYQAAPYAQGKLVWVISGEIFDAAADIREGSSTYGKWVSARLSAERKNMLWVPAGFAHGFCVMSDMAEVVYFVTGSEYTPEAERGIIWNDETLGITWPTQKPVLSEKDRTYSAWL